MALNRKTGGRQKGTPNKATVELSERARILAEIEAGIPECFRSDALAYLASIYKDPRQPPMMRFEAAKVAVAFEAKAHLASHRPSDDSSGDF